MADERDILITVSAPQAELLQHVLLSHVRSHASELEDANLMAVIELCVWLSQEIDGWDKYQRRAELKEGGIHAAV